MFDQTEIADSWKRARSPKNARTISPFFWYGNIKCSLRFEYRPLHQFVEWLYLNGFVGISSFDLKYLLWWIHYRRNVLNSLSWLINQMNPAIDLNQNRVLRAAFKVTIFYPFGTKIFDQHRNSFFFFSFGAIRNGGQVDVKSNKVSGFHFRWFGIISFYWLPCHLFMTTANLLICLLRMWHVPHYVDYYLFCNKNFWCENC